MMIRFYSMNFLFQMGACFSKVFNGCPLHINCTASWVNPETKGLINIDSTVYKFNSDHYLPSF